MAKLLWASKDRYTDSGQRLELTHPDGTVETFIVECVKLAHPRKDQVMKSEFGVRVIERSRPLLNGKTRRPIKPRSKYWTLNQSFQDGGNDTLGGFNTGQSITILDRRKFTALMTDLEAKGFKVVQTY